MVRLRSEWLRPRPERLPPPPQAEAALAAHAVAIEAGRPSYVDPATGFEVLTAVHLARRGHCCDNGCRHCPYDDDG